MKINSKHSWHGLAIGSVAALIYCLTSYNVYSYVLIVAYAVLGSKAAWKPSTTFSGTLRQDGILEDEIRKPLILTAILFLGAAALALVFSMHVKFDSIVILFFFITGLFSVAAQSLLMAFSAFLMAVHRWDTPEDL